jgi:hypothetical protein
MSNFKITVSKEEGESVHDNPLLKYAARIPEDEICWYSFFKYSRQLHLKIRNGDAETIGELDRLARLAMSPEGLTLKRCEHDKPCHAQAVEEILTLALKGEL